MLADEIVIIPFRKGKPFEYAPCAIKIYDWYDVRHQLYRLRMALEAYIDLHDNIDASEWTRIRGIVEADLTTCMSNTMTWRFGCGIGRIIAGDYRLRCTDYIVHVE